VASAVLPACGWSAVTLTAERKKKSTMSVMTKDMAAELSQKAVQFRTMVPSEFVVEK
jgi:hypothetical protein